MDHFFLLLMFDLIPPVCKVICKAQLVELSSPLIKFVHLSCQSEVFSYRGVLLLLVMAPYSLLSKD